MWKTRVNKTAYLSVILLSMTSQIHYHIRCVAHNSGKNEHSTEVCKDAEYQAHGGLRWIRLPCTNSCHGNQRTEQAIQVLWTDLWVLETYVNIEFAGKWDQLEYPKDKGC